MNAKSVTALAALGALSLPAINEAAALSDLTLPAVTSTLTGLTRGQEPQSSPNPGSQSQDPQAQKAQQEIADLKQRLFATTVELGGVRQDLKDLRQTQEYFNRMRKLGSPMEQESNLRHPVAERLDALEKQMRAPVSQLTKDRYESTKKAVFSAHNIDRDSKALEAFLKAEFPALSAAQRQEVSASFVKTMVAWGEFLIRPESIQRLEGSRHGNAAVIDFPETSAEFMNSPIADDVRIASAISEEYVAAKSLFLEKLIKDHTEEQK